MRRSCSIATTNARIGGNAVGGGAVTNAVIIARPPSFRARAYGRPPLSLGKLIIPTVMHKAAAGLGSSRRVAARVLQARGNRLWWKR
jgi:hypothetical protein